MFTVFTIAVLRESAEDNELVVNGTARMLVSPKRRNTYDSRSEPLPILQI